MGQKSSETQKFKKKAKEFNEAATLQILLLSTTFLVPLPQPVHTEQHSSFMVPSQNGQNHDIHDPFIQPSTRYTILHILQNATVIHATTLPVS